jgi:sugar lactone lactonase YvrE
MNRRHALTLPLAAALLLSSVATLTAAEPLSRAIIKTDAGTGALGFGGDGGPAKTASLGMPSGVAVTSDGGYLIADRANNRIRKVAATGIVTTVAGTGAPGIVGDNGSALAAQLTSPSAVAVRADGSILIADEGNNTIRQVTTTGIILTVAGGGFPATGNGDGGPATAAKLNSPGDVAVTPDGGFLIADTASWRIRKVSASGVITTVAGNGVQGFAGDGAPASAAQLSSPKGVAVTPDGGFLIADSDNNRIRKVDSNGIIITVAGNGTAGFSGDDGPATAAQLNHPTAITVAPTGGFYIADSFNGRVRFVSDAGKISTVAGGRTSGGFGEGVVATSARLNYPRYVAITKDGYLISDQTAQVVRRVANVISKVSIKAVVPFTCQRAKFTAHVRVISANPIKTVKVFVDKKSVALRKVLVFGVGIKVQKLKKGKHTMRVDAVDVTGKAFSITRRFKRCLVSL